jgi:hypothetical protein
MKRFAVLLFFVVNAFRAIPQCGNRIAVLPNKLFATIQRIVHFGHEVRAQSQFVVSHKARCSAPVVKGERTDIGEFSNMSRRCFRIGLPLTPSTLVAVLTSACVLPQPNPAMLTSFQFKPHKMPFS